MRCHYLSKKGNRVALEGKSYISIKNIIVMFLFGGLLFCLLSKASYSQIDKDNYSNDLVVGELLGKVEPDNLFRLFQSNYYPVFSDDSPIEIRQVKSSEREVIYQVDYLDQNSSDHPSRIIFKFFDSENSLIAAIITDEIDFAITDSYDAAEEIHKATSSFQVHFRYKNPNIVKMIAYNNQHPFLRKSTIRQALTHAINRKNIFEEILRQNAYPADGPLPNESELHVSGLDEYKFNPRKTIQMFKIEDWTDSNNDEVLDKNGKPFRISIIYEKGVRLEEQIATRVKIDWNKIGIDVVRIPLFKSEIKEALAQKNYEVILMSHLFEETIESFESFFHSKSDDNILGYQNRSVDRLIELYKRQESVASQNVMFQAIQKHINEDHPAAFLFFVWVERYVVNSKKFKNFRNNRGMLLPFTEWKFNK